MARRLDPSTAQFDEGGQQFACCLACAMLARRRCSDDQLVEVGAHFRRTGDVEFTQSNALAYDIYPVCFLEEEGFRSMEINGAEPGAPLHAILNTPVPCSRFVQWEQGYSPKERLQMIETRLMIEDQRRWQERQDAAADAREKREASQRSLEFGFRVIEVLLIGGLGIVISALQYFRP